MKRILLPIVLPASASGIAHQTAYLARQFHSEIILLHVVTSLQHPMGTLERGHELTQRDLHSAVIERAERELESALQAELQGIVVKRLLLRGDPAREIVRVAREESADLIAMTTRGHGAMYRLLLGSVTAKVLHDAACPVWTDTHRAAVTTAAEEFAIRSILCAVDLTFNYRITVTKASGLAAEFGARLTLVHITPSVEIYGPGGPRVLPELKQELTGYAAAEIAKLQRDAGTNAAVIIDSGGRHERLNMVASQVKADVLVIGHHAAGGHMGDNSSGYGIVRDSHIPVLSMCGPVTRI